MIELKLTKEEFAALNELVYENPCASGCVWKKSKNKNCDNCDFSKAKNSLIYKIKIENDKQKLEPYRRRI